MNSQKAAQVRCAHCKLDVAAWAIRKRGRLYCSAFCAGQGAKPPVEVLSRRTTSARTGRP